FILLRRWSRGRSTVCPWGVQLFSSLLQLMGHPLRQFGRRPPRFRRSRRGFGGVVGLAFNRRVTGLGSIRCLQTRRTEGMKIAESAIRAAIFERLQMCRSAVQIIRLFAGSRPEFREIGVDAVSTQTIVRLCSR